jgi:hypothetical protein
LRAVGKTFWCSGPNRHQGKIHLLVVRPAKSACPEMYLVTLNDAEHGPIRFGKPGWKTDGVEAISVSVRHTRYEAMLLMTAGSWIQSEWGRWRVSADGRRLELVAGEGGDLWRGTTRDMWFCPIRAMFRSCSTSGMRARSILSN